MNLLTLCIPEICFDGKSQLRIYKHLEVGQLCSDVIRDGG